MSASTLTGLQPKTGITRFTEILGGVLSSESKTGYRRGGFFLLAIFLPVAFVQCVFGAPPINFCPWDVVILLDGAWHIVNGQIPHTDFYNPIGPMTDLFIAFGMKIAPPSTSAITYGLVLLAALLVPLVWRIAKDRLPWALALLCALMAGSYLLSPRPPGARIVDTTYAMIYNREAYVVLLALCLCLFLPRRVPTPRSLYFDGAWAGLLLGLLLYWKITYFVSAVGLVVAAAFLVPKSRGWFMSATAASAGVCVAMFAFFRISLLRYLADIEFAVKAQYAPMRYKILWQSAANNAMWIYLLCFCLVLLSWAGSRSKATPSMIARIWLMALAMLGATLFIESGNSAQGGGLDDPLYFATAIIAAELFRRIDRQQIARPGSSVRVAYNASLALLLPLFFGTIVLGDLASFAFTVAWDVTRRPHTPSSQQFRSAQLADFHVAPSATWITVHWPVRDFPARVNEGIDLLRRNLQSGETVTTLDYSNPFPFALGLKPSPDRILFSDLNVTFSLKNAPSANDYLGNASLVMVANLQNRNLGFGLPNYDALLGLYGGYLHDHFHKVESTDNWTLYRRN